MDQEQKNNLKSEAERIITRQQARLLTFIKPVNPPEIINDAIMKYFNYAIKDIKAIIDDNGDKNGNRI